MYHCPHCIVKCYRSIDELNIHVDKCLNIDEVDRVKIDVICECPEEGKNTLKFSNYGRAHKHHSHVIADFESTLQICDEHFIEVDEEEKEGEDKIKTHRTQKHIQNSFGVKYNCIHDNYSKPIKIFNSGDPEEVNKKTKLMIKVTVMYQGVTTIDCTTCYPLPRPMTSE